MSDKKDAEKTKAPMLADIFEARLPESGSGIGGMARL